MPSRPHQPTLSRFYPHLSERRGGIARVQSDLASAQASAERHSEAQSPLPCRCGSPSQNRALKQEADRASRPGTLESRLSKGASGRQGKGK